MSPYIYIYILSHTCPLIPPIPPAHAALLSLSASLPLNPPFHPQNPPRNSLASNIYTHVKVTPPFHPTRGAALVSHGLVVFFFPLSLSLALLN